MSSDRNAARLGIAQTDINTTWVDPFYERVGKLLRGKAKFWYLAGPMSNLPAFNFPEFDRIAGILRGLGYTIVSPAEFEHERIRSKIVESEDGTHSAEVGPTWEDCLARDVCIVAHPDCIGVVGIEGWKRSKGAEIETFVASSLGKPIFAFTEDPVTLVAIDREVAYAALEPPQARIQYGRPIRDRPQA